MVLIHLAKLALLEESCNLFKKVSIPKEVHKEIKKGKQRGYADAQVTLDLIEEGKIKVKKVTKKDLIRRAYQYNIQGGEAEAVALYWQENAKAIATDDDNVRKKRRILNLTIIGTPAIIAKLKEEKKISKQRFKQSIHELRKIGWFSQGVLDQLDE